MRLASSETDGSAFISMTFVHATAASAAVVSAISNGFMFVVFVYAE